MAQISYPFPSLNSLLSCRERASRAYDTVSYFLAKYFVEIPLNVLPSLVFALIIYWMVGLNPDPERVGLFMAILMLTTLAAITLGLSVSAVAPNVDAANAMGPPLMIVFLLFGGFYMYVNARL